MLSDSRIETTSQAKRKQVCGPNKVDKKELWFRIRLRDSEVTLWYFQAMISNLRPQKSLMKVKKCKKVKVKAYFSRWSTGEDCLPYLTDGLKSRVRH